MSGRLGTLTNVIDLFGEPWETFDLPHLRAFLAAADEEGVTWEAKADDDRGRLRSGSIRKAACGLANRVGGYIIIGAKYDKNAKCWRLPGIAAPDDEPKLWLGKVIRHLSPTPRHDPKTWNLDDGRLVAVVWIEIVDEPPCMTPQGQIYERVSGETLPVRDPARIDALYRSGRYARERAESSADRAAERAVAAPEWHGQRAVGFSVALVPIGRETDDISSRLFVPSFRAALSEALQRFIQTAHPDRRHRDPDGTRVHVAQDGLTAIAHYSARHVLHSDQSAHRGEQSTWRLQATWDGAVAAGVAFTSEAIEDLTSPEEILLPSWRAVASLARPLGGYGPARLTVGLAATKEASMAVRALREAGVPQDRLPLPRRGSLYGQLPEMTTIRRWVSVGEPDAPTLTSIVRELERAAGRDSFEPEDAA